LHHIILKYIILLSSILSVNAALAIPLSSIINNDIQQVEYVEHKQSTISLEVKQVLNEKTENSLNSCESYFDLLGLIRTFDLFETSLSVVETLNTQQQYQIQKSTFLTIFVQLHRKVQQNLYPTDNKISVFKQPY
jgi:hypothetical protein